MLMELYEKSREGTGAEEKEIRQMNILIINLVRKKLRLKRYELFRFVNQKKTNNDTYYFDKKRLVKVTHVGMHIESGVSLNYLLSDECKIVRIK